MQARAIESVSDFRREASLRLRSVRLLSLLCVLGLCVSCEHKTTLLDAGQDPADGGAQGIQRATLTVTVRVSGADSALAAQLGYDQGVLPGAEVTIRRSGADPSEATGVTDALGRVVFEDLLEGIWSISFVRVLTPEETAQFDSADADVNAFGGATAVTLAPPALDVALGATAGRRGSLVISELHVPLPLLPNGATSYQYGHYVELYSNADSVIPLAGKVLSIGLIQVFDGPSPLSCDEMLKWREDPEGIWTWRWIWGFPPGAGSVEPGETVLVAVDAIDHREFVAGLQDLSHADFEFLGPNDVDNPAVPNLVRLGRPWGGGIPELGHGPRLGLASSTLVLADQIDVGARDDLPVNDPEHWRIPGERILDVITAIGTQPPALAPYCQHLVHPKFDAQDVAAIDIEALNSIKRKVLATLPDGRRILQRTKTSARDFSAGVPTPDRVP